VPPDDQFHEKLKEDIAREVRDRFHSKMDRKMSRFEEKMRRRSEHRHSPASGIVVGSIIVLVGLALLLDNMGLVSFRDLWRYWPVFLIVFGVSRILSCRRPSGYVWGGAMALIGAFLLLDNLDVIQFNFAYIWPLIIIAVGLSMLVRAIDRKRLVEGIPAAAGGAPVSGDAVDESTINIVAVLSGSRTVINNQDFRGGDAVAVFGGVRLDLRPAAITVDRAVLDVTAIFGGVELRVPEGWSVEAKGVGVFGGFDDKTLHPKRDPNVKTPGLIITGTAIFGGVSVTN
jgi:predicted membrane protein